MGRASAALGERRRDLRDGLCGALLHKRARQTEHPVAHASEVAVPAHVGRHAVGVDLAINLDHELRSRREEVDDVATEHDLPAEGSAEPAAAQGEP